MANRIKEAFDPIQAPERLKRRTKAALRKKTFDYGRNILRLRQHRQHIAAAVMSLALAVSGVGLWFLPAASIAVDINPSIELKVNALDRVITLRGRNSDGIELANTIDVTGMPYGDAMQRILLSRGLKPYLKSGSAITITVADGSPTHGEEMLSNVLCRAYNIAQEENIIYFQVDWETVKAAQAAELCIPRYLAWQQLRQKDPSVTTEDVRQMSKDVVHQLAQVKILENPCGE